MRIAPRRLVFVGAAPLHLFHWLGGGCRATLIDHLRGALTGLAGDSPNIFPDAENAASPRWLNAYDVDV
jgi:hypothetical protein